MKIENLAIIFIIIIIPIALVLSIFTQYQIQTINTQTLYDNKLTSATYDAMRAYQLNASNSTTSELSNSKIRDIEASVSTFKNSIVSSFGLNGYTSDELDSYIPALVYTMYDGFYIYSPYKNIANEDGTISADSTSGYGLKPYISYSCRYMTDNIDVVITYALDNHIEVKGIIGGKYVNESGYLIDGIECDVTSSVINANVKYNGIEIGNEQLKESNPLDNNSPVPYAKINGTKYYKIGTGNDAQIVYVLNGTYVVQCKYGDDTYELYEKIIDNNYMAKEYYFNAYKFTNWFKASGLKDLKYSDAYDEILNKNGEEAEENYGKVWQEKDTKIFQFKEDCGTNIENKSSMFNQHRLDVIRHKIETNLALAISNYNSYSNADNLFQMPELKETEWEQITHNIAIISFLQGLPIGGKIYNGYTLVTNSESEEVVLEENIYMLTSNGDNWKYVKIGDRGLEEGGELALNSWEYADDYRESAGRLNLDFNRKSISTNDTTYYYYPMKNYNASYDSVVMQEDVTSYDDIYGYISNQSNEYKKAFYTALGRERQGMYNPTENSLSECKMLFIGYAPGSAGNYNTQVQAIIDYLNQQKYITATGIFTNSTEEVMDKIQKEKEEYDLIILDSFYWNTPVSDSFINNIRKTTNIFTISNDTSKDNFPTLFSSSEYIGSNDGTSIIPEITDKGKEKLGDLKIKEQSDSSSQAIEFKDEIVVLYNALYKRSGLEDRYYNAVGLLNGSNGQRNWMHSQLNLSSNDNEAIEKLAYYAIYGIKKDTVRNDDITLKYIPNGSNVVGMPKNLTIRSYAAESKKTINFNEVSEPSREGYRFLGWSLTPNGEVEYNSNDTITLTESMVLYAIWQPENYTIHYEMNAGTDQVVFNQGDQQKRLGVPINLTTVKPQRTGYNFLGWAKSQDTNVVEYASGARFDEDPRQETIVLYAVWERIEINIIYKGNGMTFANGSTEFIYKKYYGIDCRIATPSVDTERYVFKYWSTTQNGSGDKYNPGDVYKGNTETVLYAIWELKNYNITYKGNGAIFSNGASEYRETKTYGQNYKISTPSTNDWYKIFRWNTASDGSGKNYNFGDTYTENKEITLYAVWVYNIYTVNYQGNGMSFSNGATQYTGYKYYNQNYTISSPSLRDEYRFLYWRTANGAIYYPGNVYTANSNLTLYAEWRKCVRAVGYVSLGGPAEAEQYWGGSGFKDIARTEWTETSPTKLKIQCAAGNRYASSASTITFCVQGYRNGTWENIWSGSTTRGAHIDSEHVDLGMNEHNINSGNYTYNQFRALFSSTDSERFIYCQFVVY